MKKFSAMLLFLLLSVLLLAGSAWSYFIQGYSDSNYTGQEISLSQDYWTLTDLTTGTDGEATFQLIFEEASYESDFGLYTVNDLKNPSTIEQKLPVWRKTDEPSFGDVSVWLKRDGTNWFGSTDKDNWITFDRVFGFYFNVYKGGTDDQDIDFTWYTDVTFNSDSVEHIGTFWYEGSKAYIALDDQEGGGDRDFNDMVVKGVDINPVPEPATMLLFGVGLCGLAFVGRKKLIRHG